jgi:membrane-associated protease RseP (regulator of RpoE activity)
MKETRCLGRPAQPWLAGACAILAAACGSAAHAAPPTPPGPHPVNTRRVLVVDPAVAPVRRGHLGVELVDITPELREHFGAPKDAGVLVARVDADGPAAKAGVRVGDVITAVDGQKIGDDTDLRRQIRSKKEKELASLEVLRNRTRQVVKVPIELKDTAELDLAGAVERRGGRVIVDPERVRALVDRAMRNVEVPQMRERLERRRELEDKLQQRTEALERRLERLERELKEKK